MAVNALPHDKWPMTSMLQHHACTLTCCNAGNGKDPMAVESAGDVAVYQNPFANNEDDVEAGVNDGVDARRCLMPPMPHVTIGRVLRKAAERMASMVSRAQVCSFAHGHMGEPTGTCFTV